MMIHELIFPDDFPLYLQICKDLNQINGISDPDIAITALTEKINHHKMSALSKRKYSHNTISKKLMTKQILAPIKVKETLYLTLKKINVTKFLKKS